MKTLFIILSVLSSFLANLETKTLQSDYVVTVNDNETSPLNYPGTITMCGSQFKLAMFNLEAAYDGKTMYMYSADTDELTLSNPTEQELIETNPLLYAKALVPVCNITEKPSQDNLHTIITLTPKDQSIGIDRFLLTVRKSDLMPMRVRIKEGKKMTTLQLKEPKFIISKQEYIIVPDKDTYVNDMRL